MPTSVVLGPPAHALECLRLPVPVGVAAPVIARQLEGASTLKDAFVLAAIRSHGIDFDGVAVHVTAASMALSGVGVAGKLPTLAPYRCARSRSLHPWSCNAQYCPCDHCVCHYVAKGIHH